MRNILLILVAVTLSLGISQMAYAACSEGPPNTFTCDTNAPNPDPTGLQLLNNDNNLTIHVLPGAGIDTSGVPSDAIETGDGMNVINVDGGTLSSGFDRDAIDTASGNIVGIMVHVTDSNFTSCFNCIDSGNGPDKITVERSTLNSTGNGDTIRAGNSDDEITVIDSDLFKGPSGDGIEGSGGR